MSAPEAAPRAELVIAGEPLALRRADEGDRAFIISTWVTSYRGRADVSRGVYLAEQPRLAERLLDAHGALVVCSARRPTTIHAWACLDGATLHFAYTTAPLRRHGLMRNLVVAALGEYPARVEVTHRLPFISPRFTWNPYALWRARAA